MDHIELIVFGLLVATAGLAVVARAVGVPYPIALVLGGAGIGFVPGVPDVQLDPDLVLLIFLPPLLYGSAIFTSLRDLRQNARPIALDREIVHRSRQRESQQLHDTLSHRAISLSRRHCEWLFPDNRRWGDPPLRKRSDSYHAIQRQVHQSQQPGVQMDTRYHRNKYHPKCGRCASSTIFAQGVE